MKKLISMILALTLCLSLSSVVFAAEGDFVPSISYKDEPEIVPPDVDTDANVIGVIRDADGNILDMIDDCLVITTIAQALKDVETGIPTEAELLLERVYQEILEDRMVLPFEDPDSMVIIQLLDATFLCEGSVVDTDHPLYLQPEGIRLELTFDLGVDAGVPVTVMTYKNDQWGDIHAATNNGDGTVTCVFEHLCPVAFAIPVTSEPPKTGDTQQIGLWVALLVASSVALAVLVTPRRKSAR